jgi:hypothetical protein
MARQHARARGGEPLSPDDVLKARYVHLWLNGAWVKMQEHTPDDPLTIPQAVLGCREFVAEVLARVSAAHHTPAQAEEAFTGFVAALRRSVDRNTRLLKAGKDGADLSWLPGH